MTILKLICAAWVLALAAVPAVAAPMDAPQTVAVEPHNGAFVIPVVLYHLGLKRWNTMEYGA